MKFVATKNPSRQSTRKFGARSAGSPRPPLVILARRRNTRIHSEWQIIINRNAPADQVINRLIPFRLPEVSFLVLLPGPAGQNQMAAIAHIIRPALDQLLIDKLKCRRNDKRVFRKSRSGVSTFTGAIMLFNAL